MSIPALIQVYDEMRRLAIAGSVVAGGDFRLKKLIPPLEQAGAKVPVFARTAQAVQALVDSNEQTSPQALLELCTLVNAVLYTQGATGIDGDLQPLETCNLGPQTTQASARVLKPLLDALSTTGSGRLEIIRDAFAQNAFRDLRLVKPALQALDDVYPEISDFIAEHVLPLYGNAILPELKSNFDLKGKAGHVRRLSLMHRLDPQGTRDLVKQALETGSKEIKVMAISCLGTDAEDLNFLLEQVRAKAKDVRAAALKSLGRLDAAEALAVLQNSLSTADIDVAVEPVRASQNHQLQVFVLQETQHELDRICQSNDSKQIGNSATRLEYLLQCLNERSDTATESLLLQSFDRRDSIRAIPLPDVGKSINNHILSLMAKATKKTQLAVLRAYETLDPDVTPVVLGAACRILNPAEVFQMFSSLITLPVDRKKKKLNDSTQARRTALISALNNEWQLDLQYHCGNFAIRGRESQPITWDPRWLDLAISIQDLNLVKKFARPGHPQTITFLSDAFTKALKQSKDLHEPGDLLATMIRIQHPNATDSVVAALKKHASTKSQYDWGVVWIARMIPELPQSAAAPLEELLPTLHEKAIDELTQYVSLLKQTS